MKTLIKIISFSSICALLINCGGGASSSGGAGTNSSISTSSTNLNFAELTNETSQPTESGDVNYIYLSYDDSASSAAKNLSVFSIENNKLPDMSWGRPYEFLNAETFTHFDIKAATPFNISMGVYKTDSFGLPLSESTVSSMEALDHSEIYALGINLSGPTMTIEERQNIVITFLVDVSGSMGEEYAVETQSNIRSKLDVTMHGLRNVLESFKEGDVINIVTFGTDTEVLLSGLLMGDMQEDESSSSTYLDAVNRLELAGTTNLNLGIEQAYQTAIATYDHDKANRVVIITDAYANTGEVDPAIIAQNTTINNLEGIRFAGVGVGADFNDAFLNELTDIGKGAYSAMITPEDAETIFTQGFMRFINNAVEDVRFKLTMPSSVRHQQTAAEEVSQEKEDIQSINLSYNDSQFFLELFSTKDTLDLDEVFIFEISYVDSNGDEQVIEIENSIDTLLGKGSAQILSATAVTTLAQLISTELECNDVKQTAFYLNEITEEEFEDFSMYIKYKKLIDQYCNLF